MKIKCVMYIVEDMWERRRIMLNKLDSIKCNYGSSLVKLRDSGIWIRAEDRLVD